MVGHYLTETIANWVADFAGSDPAKLFPDNVREMAQPVLGGFITAACDVRQVDITEVTESDLKTALLEHVAKLAIPAEIKPFVPSFCRAFLSDLQTRGRLGGGDSLGRYVGALKVAYEAASLFKPSTFVRPGSKIGRNDPCLCGSGKKYKNCCGH